MGYTEILTSHGLSVSQWDTKITMEYLSQLWFKYLMGPSSDAVIQVKSDLTKLPGDAITVGIRSQLQGGYVAGTTKGIGNEGKVDHYSFRMTIDNVRHLVKFEDVPMSQKRVGWDLLNSGREALVERAKIRLEEDIITALTGTSTGRVRGRYLYGNADSNWNATHATALTNVTAAAGQLTSAAIRVAKRKALIPVNAYAKIRPAKLKVAQDWEEMFFFIAHPYSVRDLVSNDAAYRNSQLLLPPNTNKQSPLYTGSCFRGMYDGVLIYEYDRMPLVSSTIQCSHAVLLGAQAGAVAWGQMPKFNMDDTTIDLGHDVVMEIHEIRNNCAKVIWARNTIDSSITDEDNGIIHVFPAAVAD